MSLNELEPPVVVRRALPADGAAFLALVDALAAYEKLDPPDPDAKRRLFEDAFGSRPRIAVLLVERGEAPVGYAILLETYSSFLARPTLYLEDVFLLPAERGRGVGRVLMREVAREAVQRGCHRIEGVVLDWNESAHGFYESTGGRVMRDWWLLRYDRAAIERLAASP